MTVKGYKKGYPIHYDENSRKWVYSDDNTEINIDRNCKNCGRLSFDYDECLGWLGDKVGSACCGHGVKKGYIVFKDGRRFEEVTYDRKNKRFTLEWYAQEYLKLTEENEQLKQQMQRLYNYFADWFDDIVPSCDFSEMWDCVKEDEEWD